MEEDWVEVFRKNQEACREALAANPDGGIFYKSHPFMVHSGQFWRCAHGKQDGCFRCAVRHPLYFLRWHGVLT